jgi:hypothetical protein
MSEILNRYGTRSASRCDKSQRKISKTMTRPYVENITKGIITDKNSQTILAAIFSVMKDHIWYAILPNDDNCVENIGSGRNHRHEHIITVLCRRGYLNYKKNKLIFIKNKWDDINTKFDVPGGLHVTYRRDLNKAKTFFLHHQYQKQKIIYKIIADLNRIF